MTLKEFLAGVSVDSERMARFVADPEAEMVRCGVSEAERLMLRAGDAAALQAALASDHGGAA